jgi:NAD(P)H dehydrogenase (quinone)
MATGYTVDMLRQSKDLVNSGKRAGVQQIVHLGACGDDDTRVAHYGWHQFIERYIEWSGVIKHYVGGARLSWVDCEDVAAVAAACLVHPEKHAERTYRLGYEAKTYYELAEVFAEGSGSTALVCATAPI